MRAARPALSATGDAIEVRLDAVGDPLPGARLVLGAVEIPLAGDAQRLSATVPALEEGQWPAALASDVVSWGPPVRVGHEVTVSGAGATVRPSQPPTAQRPVPAPPPSPGRTPMNSRSTARRLLEPVVGEKGWQALRKVDRKVRHVRRDRARRLLAQEEARRWEATTRDLTALAKHFKTDKWGNHYYTPHYQRHFEYLREQPIRLLEIGIGGYARAKDGGASLRMWKHFFPNGQIVGLDIEDKSFVEEERIKVYQGDQSDPDLLRRIHEESGPFDVIIDDGSHRVWHVLPSFQTLFPLLKDDGIYVIEDIQSSYWPEWGGSEDLNSTETSMGLCKRLADGLNYEEFVDEAYEPTYTDTHVVGVHFYHNLVFVQKGTNKEGTKRRQILKDRYAKKPDAS